MHCIPYILNYYYLSAKCSSFPGTLKHLNAFDLLSSFEGESTTETKNVLKLCSFTWKFVFMNCNVGSILSPGYGLCSVLYGPWGFVWVLQILPTSHMLVGGLAMLNIP